MLPQAFLHTPFAHRGLHDVRHGRPENSIAAVQAAIEHGYGIEVDIQMSADQQALVFHDYDLGRLTNGQGAVQQYSRTELDSLRLGGTAEQIPDLPSVLLQIAGRVPLLIEIKDQDGALGENVGPLEQAVAEAIAGYDGPVAVMSFNPDSVAAMQTLLPDVPRGLTTDAFSPNEWAAPDDRLARLANIEDYERVGACFISHDRRDLRRARVQQLRDNGATVLCWTVRSPMEEADARNIADNITFEGYLAPIAP